MIRKSLSIPEQAHEKIRRYAFNIDKKMWKVVAEWADTLPKNSSK